MSHPVYLADSIRDARRVATFAAPAATEEAGREPVSLRVPGGGGQPAPRLLLHLRVLRLRHGPQVS